MKKFQKIIPVIAAGVIATGVNTMEAQAAELTAIPDTPETPVPPVEAPAAETEKAPVINSVTENGGEEKKEDGSVEQGYLVNIDSTGNYDGTLTGTTTTDEETNTSNTVTTGKVEGETTEPADEEKDEVKDAIDDSLQVKPDDPTTPAEPVEPTEPPVYDYSDFKQKVTDAINGIYENTDVAVKTEEVDGKKSHTITFNTSSEENRPLDDGELAAILGVDSLTKNEEDGTYSYTKDGVTVTVTVNDDQSTETTNTKWTVTVVEGTQDVKDSADVDTGIVVPPVKPDEGGEETVPPTDPVVPTEPGEDGEEVTEPTEPGLTEEDVWNILDQANQPGSNATKDETGRVTGFEDDDYRYTISYVERTENLPANGLDLSAMSDKEIYDLLLSGKEGFELKEDGAVYKDGHKLTFDTAGSTLTATYYDITVTKTGKEPVYTPPTQADQDEIEADVKKKAQMEAILNALNNALNDSLTLEDIEDAVVIDKGGSWSVNLGGTEYKGTVTGGLTYKDAEGKPVTPSPSVPDTDDGDSSGAEADPDDTTSTSGDTVDIEDEKPPLAQYPDGTVITGTANATVIDKVTVPVELGSDSKGTGTITESIKQAVESGVTEGMENFGGTGEKVVSVVEADGKIATVTTTKTETREDGTVVTTEKTYTFTYTETTTKTEAEKYGDGEGEKSLEKQWKKEEGYYSFDLNGANAFVVKQSTGAVIWCSDPNMTEAKLKEMFAFDGSLGFPKPEKNEKKKPDKGQGNGDEEKKQVKFLIGQEAVTDFNLINIFGNNTDPNFNTRVVVQGNMVYVYGHDKLSHFNVGTGSTTTTTMDGKYDWRASGTKQEDQVIAEGNGTAEGTLNGSTAPAKPITGTTHGVDYSGELSYTYQAPGAPEITVDAESTPVLNVDVDVTQTTQTPDPVVPTPTPTPDPVPTPDPTPDPVPTPDPAPDPVPDPTPIPDAPVPQAPAPDTVPIPDAPVPQAPAPDDTLTQIVDDPTPMAPAPTEAEPLVEIADEEVPLVEIPELDVPLANVPRTGDSSGFWHVLSVLSASGLAVLNLKKRKDERA